MLSTVVRMPMRSILIVGLLALFVQSSLAHTYLSTVVLGGTYLAEGDCVRPHPAVTYDDPILYVSSANMTLGFLPEAETPANRKCPIAAGSTIGIQWHHNNDLAGDDIIATTHKGPILFYLSSSATGEGNVWFKIYEAGFNAATQTWATDTLIANGGLINIQIPSDIAPGNYLLRGEVIALHAANVLDGVQPYVGIVELAITGSGCATPAGVAFPGAYLDTDAGILFNIYYPVPLTSYPIPGPALYVSGSASCGTPATHAPTSAPATSAPTSAPATHAPTSAPATHAPTSAPATSAPVTSAPATGSIGVQLWAGSGAWWFAMTVSGDSQATSKVEIKDSGSVSSWTALSLMAWGAYELVESVELTLPISVRLTSSSGAQVTVSNVFVSWTNLASIPTGQGYGGSSPSTTAPTVAPTSAPATHAPTAPATHAPTTAPTVAPTTAPTTTPSGLTGVTVSVGQSASMWWLSLNVGGVASSSISSVSVKDSGSYTSFSAMTYNTWGYSMNTAGAAFVAPLTVRVTTTAGQVVTATVADIVPGSTYAAH